MPLLSNYGLLFFLVLIVHTNEQACANQYFAVIRPEDASVRMKQLCSSHCILQEYMIVKSRSGAGII